MRKLYITLFVLSLPYTTAFSQNGWIKIYDQQVYGISRAHFFSDQNLSSFAIYLQLGLTNAAQNNDAGKVYKLNKSTLQVYTPFQGGFDRIWYFSPFPQPTFHVSMQNPFCVSAADSAVALRNYVSGCGIDCGDRTYYTTNYGANWSAIPQLGNDFLGSLSRGYDIDPVNPNIMYSVYPVIGSDSLHYIYKSTNKGINWIKIDSMRYTAVNLPEGYTKINPFNTNILYVKGSSKLLISTSSGANFAPAAGSESFGDLKFNRFDHSIIAYRGTSFYKSTDNGVSWLRISSVRGVIRSITYSADNANTVFAGTTYGLYKSVNGGMNWTLFNDSFFPAKAVIGLSSDAGMGDTVFAVTNDAVYKVWGSYVGQVTANEEIPEKFSLMQNYPNPFNPVTNIQFQIPKTGFVNLAVFDVLGREVQTLVNQQLLPGTYNIDFDASLLPSGVYYYMLEAGSYSETKKMVLIK